MEDYEERMMGKKLDRWSKMRETRKSLDRAGFPYFTITVTRSSLEVPAPFVRDYGGQMMPEAIIRFESGSRVWPVVIKVTYSIRFRVRFCALWKIFLHENGLKEGDGLILSLVAMSEFVVYAFKNSNNIPEVLSRDSSHSSGDDHPETDASTPKSRRTEFWATFGFPKPVVKEDPCEVSGNCFPAHPLGDPGGDTDKFRKPKVVRCPRREDVPGRGPKISESSFEDQIQFRKELTEACTGHFGNPRFARMEIPVDFVRCYRRFLPAKSVITFEGPTPGRRHEVVGHHGPQNVTRIMLRRGWPKFVKHNKLQKGDELLFTLTAPNRFSVQQIHKQWANVDRSCKQFIKTLPPSCIPRCNPYPFLAIPASFWHNVELPREVYLQGPNSSEAYPVKCSGQDKAGAMRNLSMGWREYVSGNLLEPGDTLRFTYATKSRKLFDVDYV